MCDDLGNAWRRPLTGAPQSQAPKRAEDYSVVKSKSEQKPAQHLTKREPYMAIRATKTPATTLREPAPTSEAPAVGTTVAPVVLDGLTMAVLVMTTGPVELAGLVVRVVELLGTELVVLRIVVDVVLLC